MKLMIGEPGDKYEQQAERVAPNVMQQINTSLQAGYMQSQPIMQRVAEGGMAASPDEAIQAKGEINGNSQESTEKLHPNQTGLPDELKAGVENLSGYSLDDVKVHYNSPKPSQLQALAYTQGTEIHVAPGHEEHLPHETWHVVQQMQGRVKPTMQMKGVQINDNEGLEKEADAMGKKAEIYGEYNPSSREGQKLIGYKLTHVVQQNGNAFPLTIQRQLKYRANSWTNDENTLKNAVQAGGGAETLYDSAPNIVKTFIKTKLAEPQQWGYYNTKDPESLFTSDANDRKPLQKIDNIRAWIKALIEYYKDSKTQTGFFPNYTSSITDTEKHEQNWQKWINEQLSKITVDKTAWTTYDNDKLVAVTAAQELDTGMTIGKDYAAEVAKVKSFADKVKTYKTNPLQGKPITPTWIQDPIYGTGDSVEVEYVPGYSMPRGSGSKITTPIDDFYKARKYKEGGTTMWVKGHLLNDHVGGLEKHYNIAPLYTALNADMEKIIEGKLKSTVADMIRLERENAQRYQSIKYTVQLGPQESRAETQIWKNLATNIQTQYNTDSTISTLAPNEKDILTQFNWWGKIQTEVNALTKDMADLWEMEDQLVRDWAIKLEITYTDGKVESIYRYLDNTKYKIKDLYHNTYEPMTAKIKKDDALSINLQQSLQKPVYLEARLATLSEEDYNFVKSRLKDANLDQFDQFPTYNSRETGLKQWVASAIDLQLANIQKSLEDLKNPDIRRKEQRKTIPRFNQLHRNFDSLNPEQQTMVIDEVKSPSTQERLKRQRENKEKDIQQEYELPGTPEMTTFVEETEELIERQVKGQKREEDEKNNKVLNEIYELKNMVQNPKWEKLKSNILNGSLGENVKFIIVGIMFQMQMIFQKNQSEEGSVRTDVSSLMNNDNYNDTKQYLEEQLNSI
ncbi:DUF4157 domain-containing protein [Nostoc spongiaeforme FACHB-130]|uniref:DUF4157 domain-containing protein n=2 Tax=Nostoc TaxID=1177 RepID=A0ABR8FVP4_9NOSO|nr:DUF4157 domain-containing protein [Nostoc spongiaeforme FACHB-130]